ncbi:MAG: HAD family hydrolase [Clostridia bacterium]|nr:HAD family hydrolase [Clostridia bacterium]
MIKAAIFDLDGTLANTLPDLTEGMCRARARYGFPPITEKEILKFVNGTTDDYVHKCFPEGQDEDFFQQAKKVYIEEYSRCYLNNTYAYEGMTSLMDDLKSRGIRLAVFTNKDHKSANDIVKKLYGDGVFEIILGTGFFPGKPDPAGALYLAEKLGAKPSETVFIGDSDVDVNTAKNAGMIRLDVSWGYRDEAFLHGAGAQYIAHDAGEILKIIDKINSER